MLTKHLSLVGLLGGLALLFGYVMAKGYLPLMPILPKPGRTPGVGVEITEYDAQGLVLVVIGLVLVFGLYLIPKMARGSEESSFLIKLFYLGFLAKMGAAMVRMWTNYDIYGFRDVGRYHNVGGRIAEGIRDFDFTLVAANSGFGTPFTFIYTGIIYTITGPTIYGGYLAFAALSFLGSYFFYRAFRLAFPESNYRLYGILIFLFPSVIYWANGIGKDALMFLFVGLAAYGGALLLVKWRIIGLLPLAIGLTGTLTIREEVTWMLILGLVATFLLGRASSGGLVAKFYRTALLGAGLLLFWIMLPSMLDEFGMDELTLDAGVVENLDQYYAQQQRRPKGGSGFESTTFTDPLFVPMALATAVVRPFPWEAHNFQAMIQALDGFFLMGLMAWRGPKMVRSLGSFRTRPYLIFVLVYSVLMILALMTVVNFGTLVRTRSMLLPIFMMLIALEPLPKKSPAPGPNRRSTAPSMAGQVATQT